MEAPWQPPEAWQKDGSTLSGITHVKTGAWTTILAAKEAAAGHSADVVIKVFSVPESVLEDPPRIAAERDKFLKSAYLQKSLVDKGAHAWVKILKIVEDPTHPAFAMEKCGPSLEDLFDNKIPFTAKDLYALVLAILDGLIELKATATRSHGNLKMSDILSSLPGHLPAYKLSDPASKGEEHSANDLFSVGQILFQLIESKEWEAMTQILPTSRWSRFGVRRDRWIQFCNLLLSPNGCQDPLPAVKKEALRLKPVSSLRFVFLGIGGFALIAAGALGYHLLLQKLAGPAPIASTNSATQIIVTTAPHIDPETLTAYDKAHLKYQQARTRWVAINPTPRYDHTKSRALARESRTLLPDQIVLTDNASYQQAVDEYTHAAAKLDEATQQLTTEETAGQQQDGLILTDYQHAQSDYLTARAAWNTAAAKFTDPADHADHTQSKALAQAGDLSTFTAPTDVAALHAATDQFRAAAAKLNDALATIPKEEQAALSQSQVKTQFDQAKAQYEKDLTAWSAAEQNKDLDLTQASATAAAAQKILPDPLVLTDLDSYRSAAALYQQAAKKLEQALTQAGQAVHRDTQEKVDIATALANANTALKSQKYADALVWYRKAADLGNPSAMRTVGLLYENGQGTDRDYAQAAAWYKKAADLGQPSAMCDLAYLYERGRGVTQDYDQAAQWYKKAAGLNDSEAMCDLGVLYENGEGVDRDYDQAMLWYKKAADLRNPIAMTNIGVFYEKGRGTTIDYAQALLWYQKAADLGSASAMNDIAALYDNGHGVKQSPADAMIWYRKAADHGYAPAMCNIGTLYDNGQGVPLDHAEAMKWFKKAAALGNGLAMFNVGVLYESGRGVAVDMPEALTWYRKAARSNDESGKQLAIERLDKLGYSH